MRFHVFCLLPHTPAVQSLSSLFDDAIELVDAAESLGFHGIWTAEHHTTNYSLTGAPLLFLARAAERTKRIRLGTAVMVLPLWHPVRAAAEVATLDQMSNGRFDLGVGKGYQPVEFDAFGADIARNHAAFEECLRLMLRLWQEDEVTHEGRFYTFRRPVTLLLRPRQRPFPPIWVASSRPETVMETARWGFRSLVGVTNFSFAQMKALKADYDKVMKAQGKSDEDLRFGSVRQVAVLQEGQEIGPLLPHLRAQYRQSKRLRQDIADVKRGLASVEPLPGEPNDNDFLSPILVGTAEQCIRKLRLLEASGITDVLCQFELAGLPLKHALASMQRFAEQVMPAFRASVSLPHPL